MPVTKKKGAIFAIYADSPDAKAAPPYPSNGSAKSVAQRSPTKRRSSSSSSSASRRVLSVLPPTSRGLGFPSAVNENNAPLKPKTIITDNLLKDTKGNVSALSVNHRVPVKNRSRAQTTVTAISAKRQFQIFASPDDEQHYRNTASVDQVATQPLNKSYASPVIDKENAPPVVENSPSTRTRSKSALLAVSPIRPSITSRNGADASCSKKMLSKKFQDRLGSRGGHRATPLIDVSEVYGATGEEPSGFRDAGS